MSDFSELWGAKGGQSRCFGVTFGSYFGDFLHSGWIVKMELSLSRELNLEGWKGWEITQISVFFEDLFQNLKKKVP